ncbi:MAG: citrate/2-methylcitrate synthase [Tepidisphaeraceae bacterium]
MTQPLKPSGLEGVVATQSAICFIDGDAGRLVFRGYEIGDLVEHATFEETAYLLWKGDLPNKQQLADLKKQFGEAAKLPPHVMAILKALPKESVPMDAFRTAASALSSTDPDLLANTPEANLRKAIRMTAQFPTIVAAFHRLRNGQTPVEPDPSLSIAANFLYMLTGKKAHETHVRAMDAALVVHAEHGLNASTFACRVTAATLSDIHAAVTAAIAALKGPLHGGANQDVMELLLEAGDQDTLAQMAKDALAKGGKIPGFGHRVYKVFDPRATFLSKISKQLGEAAGNLKWYEMQQVLIPIVKNTKNKDPNVDFFSASAYYTMGIPLDLFTCIFGIARVAGWTAHAMEQHSNNRIIRPLDEYVGPFDRKVVPLEKR